MTPNAILVQRSAATAAVRLLDARAAYDLASGEPAPDFTSVTEELDAAVAAFCSYTCRTLADLASYAACLWEYVAAEQVEVQIWGDDATAPLWELFPIAAAVRREFDRLMPAP